MSKTQVNKLHTLFGHNHSIYALAEGADSRFFYTGAGDGMVVEWDLDHPKDGKLVAKLPHSVYALTVDKKRNLLFIGHNFEGIHAIDLDTREEVWSLKITDESIFDLQVIGNQLYVGTGGGVIVVLDIEKKAVARHLKVSEKSVRVFSLNPVKNHLAVGTSDHSVIILDLNDGVAIHRLTGHSNSVFALSYSPNGELLISGGRDAHLKIWETEEYKEVESIVAHMFAINYVAFREDGRYFVTCSMDKSIKLWDALSFKLLKVIDRARHAGHGTSINKVFWSKHNSKVVAVSDDRTVTIWDINFIEK